MHLYIITRGIKKEIDDFINQLQGKYFPFKCPDPTPGADHTKLTQFHNQIHVRPIQLWEIVFPEEHKDIALNTILSDFGDGRNTQHKKHEKIIWGLRKALGVDPVPEYKKDQKLPIAHEGMEVVGIGIKKDYWQDCKTGKRYDHKENEDCFEGL